MLLVSLLEIQRVFMIEHSLLAPKIQHENNLDARGYIVSKWLVYSRTGKWFKRNFGWAV